MKKISAFALLALTILLGGCMTRSISNSGYDADRYGHAAPAELSEFDVLGIDPNAKPSDDEIASQLKKPRALAISRASKILLIQSGAPFPDEPMVRGIAKRYSAGQFSGVKAAASATPESYARTLRLAAAQGGYDKVLIYWGVLESARENLATSSVSWVPVVGWLLPDERQRMRIRLKLILVDVATGQWAMVAPEPIDDRSLSSILSRRDTDQGLVTALKEKAYLAAADELAVRFEK